jgi:hypothetical protein
MKIKLISTKIILCHTKSNLKVSTFLTQGHITYLVSNNLVSLLFKDQQLILLVLLKSQHICLFIQAKLIYSKNRAREFVIDNCFPEIL